MCIRTFYMCVLMCTSFDLSFILPQVMKAEENLASGGSKG